MRAVGNLDQRPPEDQDSSTFSTDIRWPPSRRRRSRCEPPIGIPASARIHCGYQGLALKLKTSKRAFAFRRPATLRV